MNTVDLSSLAIPELVPLTGSGGPLRARNQPVAVTARVASDEADVEVAIADTLVRIHAMFRVDPETSKVHVSIVDDQGRVIRLIPSESVAQMIEAMASYPTSR